VKRFYLAGQNNFGNRGCEALVRSTLQLLKAEFGNVEVLVPSYRPDLDAKQWPEAASEGCQFVRATPYPIGLKIWGRLRKFMPAIKHLYLPDFSPPTDIRADIKSCDAMLLIGGDNITLDYGIENLLFQIRFVQYAQRTGKKVMLWGASVGPFTAEPAIEKFVASFLRSIDYVTVRETISHQYLASIGIVANAALAVDGAFVMSPQPFDTTPFWPASPGNGVLGFNISPLIQKFRPADEPPELLQREVADFIKTTLDSSDASILLVPHVDPLDGATNNSDSHYMRQIMTMVNDTTGRLSIAPGNLNAAQLKYVLSQCTYFIGARTHATIAALSCLVPTVSIAYSIKAKGLNRDLFGDEKMVLETPDVNRESLIEHFRLLTEGSAAIGDTLKVRIPLWREKAAISSHAIAKCLDR
jgi:colanic acid/amylovoran biosynthesis protein